MIQWMLWISGVEGNRSGCLSGLFEERMKTYRELESYVKVCG